eukprot:2580550-Pleurochrysis_carterae.AAC.1
MTFRSSRMQSPSVRSDVQLYVLTGLAISEVPPWVAASVTQARARIRGLLVWEARAQRVARGVEQPRCDKCDKSSGRALRATSGDRRAVAKTSWL